MTETTRQQLQPVIERLDILATEAGTAPAIPAYHYGCLRDIIEGLANQIDTDTRAAVMRAQLYRELLLCLGVVCLFLLATLALG